MIDLNLLDGKRLGLILWSKDTRGEDEAMVHVGTASWNGVVLTVEVKNHPPFQVRPEWFGRIKKTDAETKGILLNSEYCISLLVSDLPNDAKPGDFKKTGIKWSKKQSK